MYWVVSFRALLNHSMLHVLRCVRQVQVSSVDDSYLSEAYKEKKVLVQLSQVDSYLSEANQVRGSGDTTGNRVTVAEADEKKEADSLVS